MAREHPHPLKDALKSPPQIKNIFLFVIIFLLFGHAILFSATAVLALHHHESEFHYLIAQIWTSLLGLVLMSLFSYLPSNTLKKLAPTLLWGQIFILLLTRYSPLGHSAQGATRWISFLGFSFQPSEMSKIVLVLFLANLFSHPNRQKWKWLDWAKHLSPIFLMIWLVYKEPDLGTCVLLTLTGLAMGFLAGLRTLYVLLFLSTSAGFFVFSLLHSGYRKKRILAFLDPFSDPHGKGFQTIQSLLSFYHGKLLGVGLGNSSLISLLPEIHTDFIFALIGEELGFVGSVSVILLFVLFLYTLFKIVLYAKDDFSKYLTFGLICSLALQILVNLGGVTALLPIKGLPLPFLSWGRSALITHLMLIGILLSVLREANQRGSEQKRVTHP